MLLIAGFFLLQTVVARVHHFHFNVTWTTASFDGVGEREVISINGATPLPKIEVDIGDTVLLNLTNNLEFVNTSLHFHGLFQNGSNTFDGPEFVTQCPVSPGDSFLYNFTVHQAGTYWYHSHSGMQYGDGLRGAFVVHDKAIESQYEFDKELIWTVTDWYYDPSWALEAKAKSRYNPTGAEPVPQNILFDDTRNVSVPVETNTTYLVHLINTGMFVSQYIYIEDHEFTVIELDGVYMKPNKTDVIYISTGQRMSVLITTKSTAEKNYPIVQVMDEEMLDVVPSDLELIGTNWLTYDEELPKDRVTSVDKDYLAENYYEDFYAQTIDDIKVYDSPDVTIDLTLDTKNLGDGINYMMLNDKTYVAPKVPTLYTVLTAGEHASNVAIYGSNTNAHVIQRDEIIDIVLKNLDDGKHPFHLHGHTFQVIHKSPARDEPEPFSYSDIDIPEYPSVRDTVQLQPNGVLVLRFKADNPGVWFFHCHVDYHVAAQGLAITIIEAPLELQELVAVNDNQMAVCHKSGVPHEGNAAANLDFFNLEGENLQPADLPEGFTLKGYVAFAVSTLIGLYGLWTIKSYGMSELGKEDEEKVIGNLREILKQHGVHIDESSALNLIDENTVLSG